MQDWRIGRLIRWGLLGSTDTALTINANSQRVALQITPEIGNLTAGIEALCVQDSVSGKAFYVADSPYSARLFTLAEYGSIIQRKLVIQNTTGSLTFTVWEATMPEDYLAAGLEQFKSEYGKWNL